MTISDSKAALCRPSSWPPFPDLELLCATPPAEEPGINREDPALSQIGADTDPEAVLAWLAEFAAAPETYRAYRQEAEKLIYWAAAERGKPISGLNRQDLAAYEAFLERPAPESFWVGPKIQRRLADGSPNPKWRPFAPSKTQRRSEASVRRALAAVDGLFSYLVKAGHLKGNPQALSRRRSSAKSAPDEIERVLSPKAWIALSASLSAEGAASEEQKEEKERALFCCTFMALLGPRISEMASHTHSSLERRRGRWWWRVLGKGNKEELIPVPQEAMAALTRYRKFLRLPPFPGKGDATPLAPALGSRGGDLRPIKARALHNLLKKAFRAAAERTEDPDARDELEKASAHWLRHTSVTLLVDSGVDLRHVNKSARHAKLETTGIYVHAEKDAWAQAVEGVELPK